MRLGLVCPPSVGSLIVVPKWVLQHPRNVYFLTGFHFPNNPTEIPEVGFIGPDSPSFVCGISLNLLPWPLERDMQTELRQTGPHSRAGGRTSPPKSHS